jgi:adenosine deaminase
MSPIPVADCHLHFEGSLPIDALGALARRAGHRFADPTAFEAERSAIHDRTSFLALYREVCGLFRSPGDYGEAARAVARSIGEGGAAYAEVYVSPEIPARFGLDAAGCLIEIDRGFRDAEAQGSPRCRILLDAVRQWGLESAERVLDLHERTRLPSVAGFGLGGDERAAPAAAFAGTYLRARSLGLKTSVHAGEWDGVESLREALDHLRPDRVDHGIAAAEDPRLLARLAEESTALWVAPTSNAVTGAVEGVENHPLPRLLDAGVCVALGADDPLLFATTTAREHEVVRERLGFGTRTMALLAENSWRASFCSADDRRRASGGSDSGPRRPRRGGPPQPSVVS